MKKVLIITYYWPPGGGSGVQRWMYFSKYLKENGIEPTVITIDPKNGAYPSTDQTLLKHTEGTRVIHTKGGFQLLKFYSFLKTGNGQKHIPAGDFGSKKKSVFDKFAGYIRANWFIPDARVGWNKQVLPVARELLANEKFDLVITTGPPNSTHLIGLELKAKTGIRWMADFRDPWREVFYNDLFKRTKRSEKKDAFLESEVILKSDAILTVGPSMRQLLSRKLPNELEKFHFILNGYDSEMFEFVTSERYSEFTIAHIGVWGLLQPHTEIFESLKKLSSETADFSARFVIAGAVNPMIIGELNKIPGLIVDYRGKVTHPEAIQEMLNADLLLNCLPLVTESQILISGKLMEYIASGNKLLVIGNLEGDAAALLSEVPQAMMIAPGSSENTFECFRKVYLDERKAPESTSSHKKYSRRETAKELAQLIRAITQK